MRKYLFLGNKSLQMAKIHKIYKEYTLNVPNDDLSSEELLSILFDYIENNVIQLKHLKMVNEVLNTCIISGSDFLQDIQNLKIVHNDENKTPVISIMGHVNHGKTSLIKCLKKIDSLYEVGNITQNITAFTWEIKKQSIFLIDTPGHAILSSQRQFVSYLNDIAIIVIDISQGVSSQTIEAINLAKHKQLIICITQIDKVMKPLDKNSKLQTIYGKLQLYNIIVSAIGGDTPIVEVSVKKGYENSIENLKNIIYETIQKLQLKTEINRPAIGYVLDSYKSPQGLMCNLYIEAGILNVGDTVLINDTFSKIKSIKVNDKSVKSTTCHFLCVVTGISAAVSSDRFMVIPNNLLDYFKKNIGLIDTKQEQLNFDKDKENFICVADSSIKLQSLSDMVKLYGNVIRKSIGEFSDLKLAKDHNCTILVFGKNIKLLKDNSIPLISSEKIYDIEEQLQEKNKKTVVEINEVAQGEVLKLFNTSDGYIVGCKFNRPVQYGKYKILNSENEVIYDGSVQSIRIGEKQLKPGDTVPKNTPCGLRLKNCSSKMNIKEKDKIVCYEENIVTE